MPMPDVTPLPPKVILFDGVCNLCAAWVSFVVKRDPGALFKFASVQSDAGQALLSRFGFSQDDFETMIYIESGQPHTRSTAFLKIVKYLKFPWPLLGLGWVVPRPIRDWVYNRIALNRYKLFGKKASCELPTKELSARFLQP